VTLPPLYAIVDAELAARHGWTVPALARACLAGGARLLQIRAKHVGSGALLAICEEVLAEAGPAGATIIVNDRADVAMAAGAAGVHLGQQDLPVRDVRRLFPALGIVGLSTHTEEQIGQALGEPASYIAVGPVYGTATKATGYDAVGLGLVRKAVAAVSDREPAARPVVAIGGITLDRAPDVLAAGAASVAVISDLLATGDPEGRVREYVRRLNQRADG
jgi:thiamine-phosphate pyrophosphorylase